MNSHLRRTRRGVTLVEITVVAVVILALAAILFPVVDSAMEKAHQGDCLSHQKQLAASLLLYAQDNGGVFPLPSQWVAASGFAANSEVFDCPSTYKHGTGTDPDYGMNAYLYRSDATRTRVGLPTDRVTAPATVELTSDLKELTKAATGNYWTDEFSNPFPQSYTLPGFGWFAGTTRHGPGVIASFCDGHAELLEGQAMGTKGTTPYNIPPGYGRVSLDLTRVTDAADARQAMQTFLAFAATWQAAGGTYDADNRCWTLAPNQQLMTSAEGQTYDKNCFFNGATNFGLLMMEFDCTPGAKLAFAAPNDLGSALNPPADPTNQNEKMNSGLQSIYFLDTTENTFQVGLTKAVSDLNIWSGYTPNTWVDLPSPYAGQIMSIPSGVTSFRVSALINFKNGTEVPFPTDPTNAEKWACTGNHATGRQLCQNIQVTLGPPARRRGALRPV